METNISKIELFVKQADFIGSFTTVSKCPEDEKPAYAFIGRSNVGKSSLINFLCNRRGLAKVSSTPGKTTLINYFLADKYWYLVDLPGYGYAKKSKTERSGFDSMIRNYLLKCKNLSCVMLLIDIRIKPQAKDREFMEWLGKNGVPFCIIFTKGDHMGEKGNEEHIQEHLSLLNQMWEPLPTYFITSAEKGFGRESILTYIQATNSLIEKERRKK